MSIASRGYVVVANNSQQRCLQHRRADHQVTDRMGVATGLPPKYDEAGLLHENRVGRGVKQRVIATPILGDQVADGGWLTG
jgi:hypothetical protein